MPITAWQPAQKKINFTMLGNSSIKELDSIMAVRVVEFSNGGYKIRKIFA